MSIKIWFSNIETFCLKYSISSKTCYNVLNSSINVTKYKDWRNVYYDQKQFLNALNKFKSNTITTENHKVKKVTINKKVPNTNNNNVYNHLQNEGNYNNNFTQNDGQFNTDNEVNHSNYYNNKNINHPELINTFNNNKETEDMNSNNEQLNFIKDSFNKDVKDLKDIHERQISDYQVSINDKNTKITELNLSVTTKDNDIRLKTTSLSNALEDKRNLQKRLDDNNDALTNSKINHAKLKIINKIYIIIIIIFIILLPLSIFVINFLNIKF